MVVMTAVFGLELLGRFLGTGHVTVLQCLTDLGQGAIAVDVARASGQRGKSLLCPGQIAGLQS